MHFSYPLIIALSALSSVNAECWHSGPSTTKAAIAGSVVTVCNYLQSPGYLKGEERYQCVQDALGVKWDFSLKVVGTLRVLSGLSHIIAANWE